MRSTKKEWIVYIMIALIIGIFIPYSFNSIGSNQEDTVILQPEKTTEKKLIESVNKLTKTIEKLNEEKSNR